MRNKLMVLALMAAIPAAVLGQDSPKDQPSAEQERSQADLAKAKADLDQARGDAKSYDRALAKVREQRQIKGAWLGLSASPPPAALRRQLKLPDGTGLVIDFIQPDSPAAKANLKQYDLLTKLNDQILVNPEQLSVLIRMYKPGNKVRLEFLREGEHQSTQVELAEHELPPLSDENGFGPVQLFQFQPDGKGEGWGGTGSVGGAGRGMMKVDPASIRVEAHTISLVDGKRQLSIDVNDDKRMLTVLDARSGRIMSKYAIDSQKQLDSLPDDLKKPVNILLPMLDSSGIRMTAKAGSNANNKNNNQDGQSSDDARPASSSISRSR